MTDSRRPLITLENVGFTYKKGRTLFSSSEHRVFQGLSFQIYEGDAVGIVGRNGAGKSTLLRLLAGIVAPDEGVIKRGCVSSALLALGAGFNHQLDGRINIVLNGMLLGFSKRQVEEKLESIIDFSELGESIDDPVKTYSAGMRARLAFSIAINMHPDVLLIDEALGVGDAGFLKKSGDALRARVKSGQTVVLVSHQADTVRQMCNRVIWIENGELQQEGDAKTVLAAYEQHLAPRAVAK
jgi:lipopolysaccharide transport system ATP-binding protein